MTAGAFGFFGASRSNNYVVFDGTADYFTRGALSGASDNKQLTISFWIKPTDFAVNRYLFDSYDTVGGRIVAYVNTAGWLVISINDFSGVIATYTSDFTLSAGQKYHCLVSFDLSDTGKRHCYINDIEDDNWASGSYNDRNIPYSLTTQSAVGSAFDGSVKTKAQVYDLYVNNAYIDLSVEANRRKFITAAGKPAVLGYSGSIPTGTQPLVYFNGFGSFKNTGSSGMFTQYGTLTRGDAL